MGNSRLLVLIGVLALAACDGSSGALDSGIVYNDIRPGGVRVTTAGGAGFDRAYTIAVDAKGNRYVAGYFEKTAHFGALTLTGTKFNDLFVARLGHGNMFDWVATSSGGSGPASYNTIAVDSAGNSYVSGHYLGTARFGPRKITSRGDNDGFVVKLDPAGKFLWAKSLGGSGMDGARALAAHPDGGVVVVGHFSLTGYFGSSVLPASGETDIFVARLGHGGNVRWVKAAGGSRHDEALAVAVDSVGRVTVTGSFQGTASFGNKKITSAGKSDMFVTRLGTTGAFGWTVSGGGPNVCVGSAVAAGSDGEATVAGTYHDKVTLGAATLGSLGATDIFVLRLGSDGSFKWVASAGGESLDLVGGIAVDGKGVTYLTGAFMASAYFGDVKLCSGVSSDLFLAGLSPTGAVLWAQLAGGSQAEGAHGVALGPNGRPHLTGYFKGLADFGGKKVQSAGDADIFIWDL